jgi:hypothetical protein
MMVILVAYAECVEADQPAKPPQLADYDSFDGFCLPAGGNRIRTPVPQDGDCLELVGQRAGMNRSKAAANPMGTARNNLDTTGIRCEALADW